MKPAELRELTDEELTVKLEELKRDYFNMRFQNTTQQLESPAKIRDTRRDIARVHTIRTEREKKKNG